MGLEKVWSVVWVKAKNITPKIARRREALKKGSARRSFLKGRERAIVNETNVGSVSKATLGKLLKGGVERIRSFRAHRYHLELN